MHQRLYGGLLKHEIHYDLNISDVLNVFDKFTDVLKDDSFVFSTEGMFLCVRGIL